MLIDVHPRAVGLLLALLVLGAPSAEASSRSAQWAAMEAATVRVLCIRTPTELSNGSGFVIGRQANSRYVITNWHVVECTSTGGQARIVNGSTARDLVAADVRAHDAGRDIAVLETAIPLGRAPVPLATVATVRKRDTVWAYGFPGAGDRDGVSLADASVSKGVVGRLLLELADRSAARMIQHSAGINPGNSGGPLFDDFGRVVGINTQKSLTAVLTVDSDGTPQVGRVPEGEGIGWAVISDDLIDLLDHHRIPYQVTASRPSTLAVLWHREPLLVLVLGFLTLLAVMAITLTSTQRGRALVRDQISRRYSKRDLTLPPKPRPLSTPSPMPEGAPCLRGLAGPYAGALVPLSGGTVTIGRDPALAQLVLPPSATKVSKRHATVAWNAERQRFTLKDCWSTHGIMVNGQKIPPGATTELTPGQRFELADATIVFEVNLS